MNSSDKKFLSDIEIAQNADIKPIKEVAKKLNLNEDDLELYGKYKAKIPLNLINEDKIKKSNLILVTAITPTPAGEGKTTTSIALNEGLNKLGKKALAVLREPSLGPVFGIKGGAAGGGYSQVIPMEDINLHFTGDFSAIEKANNLLAALIDNNLQNKKNNLNIDPRSITWKRVMDMNDRSLRKIIIGVGGTANGIPREDGFNITAASEVMAILCLSKDFEDLKNRLARIYIGNTFEAKPIYAGDLKAEEAMAILLKDAIKPNLVQTLENNPVIIHGGPFANIAQGTNSIIATKTGLSLSDYVITEAGFGADLGAEKFFHIKCNAMGVYPKAVVLLATLRALRHHGGALKEEYNTPDINKVKLGFSNLKRHIENLKKFGYFPIVALNAFPTDTKEEYDLIKSLVEDLGCKFSVCKGFAEGGNGSTELAQAVLNEVEENRSSYKNLYEANDSIKEKIHSICSEIYRAKKINYSPEALGQLKKIEKLNIENIRICMAKTQKSFSENENEIGAPDDFELNIKNFEIAAGAGYIIPIIGQMVRMPGLPNNPASENMKIDKNGVISGLS